MQRTMLKGFGSHRQSLAWELVIGILVAVLSTVASTHEVGAEGRHHVIVGLAVSQSTVTQWWHGPGTSLDLSNYPNNPFTLPGTSVYWQSHDISGNDMWIGVTTYTGVCKGLRVAVYDYWLGSFLGYYSFVHMDNITSQWAWVAARINGWSFQYVGSVAGSETPACVGGGLWSGPHLHQQSDGIWVAGNSGLQGLGNPISPTGDWISRYVHHFWW